jgi:hypothetical protein
MNRCYLAFYGNSLAGGSTVCCRLFLDAFGDENAFFGMMHHELLFFKAESACTEYM